MSSATPTDPHSTPRPDSAAENPGLSAKPIKLPTPPANTATNPAGSGASSASAAKPAPYAPSKPQAAHSATRQVPAAQTKLPPPPSPQAEGAIKAPTQQFGVTQSEAKTTADSPGASESTPLEETLFEIKRVVVGQGRMLERLLVCLLAKGHCLLEGVPGIAKTLSVETLATAVGGSFVRLQFTPDMLPADIVGTRIWRPSRETFDIELGPIAANLVLADEINRAPAKVQSALLEAMAERQVSIGGTTFDMPDPFLVLATQNPIEQEGVYPLPEAQRDRFLMKVVIDYPTAAEEVEIVTRMGAHPPESKQVLSLEQLKELQAQATNVVVDRGVVDYAVSLTLATRDPGTYGLENLAPLISYGASPRASLGLVKAARALAVIRNRSYVLPQDVFDVAPEVMRHRVVLSYEAIAREVTADHVVAAILATVPAPRIAPSQDPTYGDRG